MSFYKQKKAAELRELSSEQLRLRLQDIGKTLIILEGQKAAKHAVNPGQWRNIKREKARILTILGERKNPWKGGFRHH